MNKAFLPATLLFSLLTACGGGGSGSSGSDPTPQPDPDKPTNPSEPTDPSEPTTPEPAADGFTYLFSGSDLISYNFTNDQFSDIAAEPKSFDLNLHANQSEFAAADAVFYLQNNHWMQVNRKTNQPEQVSSATLQTEVCDTFVLSDSSTSHLFYTTAGADTRCSDEDDNISFRIDSNMTASSAPVSLANNLQISINETDPVLINNRLVGFLIKDSSNNLLFSNLNTTTTVQLAANVAGQVSVYNFTSRNKALTKVDNKLYDLSLEQLESGNLGDAIFTNTQNILNVFSQDGRLFYKGGADSQIHHFDAKTGVSTVIFDAATSTSGKTVSNVEVGHNGILIKLNSDELLLVNLENLSAPVNKLLSVAVPNSSSSTTTVDGGFIIGGNDNDGAHRAIFISDNGDVTTINNADWLRVDSSSHQFSSLPVLFRFGSDKNALTLWSATTKTDVHSLGEFDKHISDFRVDLFVNDQGKVLLSSRSNESAVNGQVFGMTLNSANSLKVLKAETGHFIF